MKSSKGIRPNPYTKMTDDDVGQMEARVAGIVMGPHGVEVQELELTLQKSRFVAPIFLTELLQDRVRSRTAGVMLLVVLYLVLAYSILGSFKEPNDEVLALKDASLPSATMLDGVLSRVPAVQVLQGLTVGEKDRTVNISVKHYYSERSTSPTSLNCDSEHRKRYAGTLYADTLAGPCNITLSGASARSDNKGVVIFNNLSKTHGPPGTYTFVFETAGVANTLSYSIKDVSSVARLEFHLSPNKGPKNPIKIGEHIVTEMAYDHGKPGFVYERPIELKVMGYNGLGLAGKTVHAFAWPHDRFFGSLQSIADVVDLVPIRIDGLAHATLGNSTAVTDGGGVANFTHLSITGTTSRNVYIYFFCEGKVVSWANSDTTETMSAVPQTRTWRDPAIVDSNVTGVAVIGGASSLPDLIDEGNAFPEFTVQITGSNLEGQRIFAQIVSDEFGDTSAMGLRRREHGQELKELTGAWSTTNSTGIATFSDLRFTLAGPANPNSSDIDDQVGPAYAISFACNGFRSADYKVAARTTVASLQIVSPPKLLFWQDEITRIAEEDPIKAMTTQVVLQVVNNSSSPVAGKFISKVHSLQLVYTDDDSAVPDDQASFSLYAGHPLLLPGASGARGLFDVALQVRFLKGATHSGESSQGYTFYRPPRNISAIFEVDGIKSSPVPLPIFARRNAPPAGCFGLLHVTPHGSRTVSAKPPLPTLTRGEPGSPVWEEDSSAGISLPTTMSPLDWKGDLFVPSIPIGSRNWTNSTDVTFLAGFYKAAPAYQLVELEPARPAGRENLDPFVDWQGKGWFSTAESVKANDDPSKACPSSCNEHDACPATCPHVGGLCIKDRFATCPAVHLCVILNLVTQAILNQPATKFCDTNSGVQKRPIEDVESDCTGDVYCAGLRSWAFANSGIPNNPEHQTGDLQDEEPAIKMTISTVMTDSVWADLGHVLKGSNLTSQFIIDNNDNSAVSGIIENINNSALISFSMAAEYASRVCSDANDQIKVWCNRLRTVTPGSHTVRFEAIQDVFGTIPSGGTAADTTNYCTGAPFKVNSQVARPASPFSVTGGDSTTVVSQQVSYTKIDTFQKGYGPFFATPLHVRINRGPPIRVDDDDDDAPHDDGEEGDDRESGNNTDEDEHDNHDNIMPGAELQIVPLRFPLGVPMTDTLPSALQQSMRHHLELATPAHRLFVGDASHPHFQPEPQAAPRPFHIRWLFQVAFNDPELNSLIAQMGLDPLSYIGGFNPEEPIDCSNQSQWDDNYNYNILLYHPFLTEDAKHLYEVACLIHVDTNSMLHDIHFIAEDGPAQSHYFWFKGGHLGVYGLALNDVGAGESATVVATSGPVEVASILITQQPCAEEQTRAASDFFDSTQFRVDTGPCVVHDGCVSRRDYRSNEICEVSVLSDCQLFLNYIDLESGEYDSSGCFDYLQLSQIDSSTANYSMSPQYCPSGPGNITQFRHDGLAADAGSVLYFKSDSSITASGWTVCNRSDLAPINPPAARCDRGKRLPDVGLRFDIQPTVYVTDTNGDPVQGLRVGAMFVSANETYGRGGKVFDPDDVNNENSNSNSIWDPLLYKDLRVPAMADIAPDDFQTTTGNRLSDPSDDNGLARFNSLTFVDALPGCYRVLFYVAYDPYFMTSFEQSVTGAGGWRDAGGSVLFTERSLASSSPSEIVCVDAASRLEFTKRVGGPRRQITLGKKMPAEFVPAVSRITRVNISEFDMNRSIYYIPECEKLDFSVDTSGRSRSGVRECDEVDKFASTTMLFMRNYKSKLMKKSRPAGGLGLRQAVLSSLAASQRGVSLFWHKTKDAYSFGPPGPATPFMGARKGISPQSELTVSTIDGVKVYNYTTTFPGFIWYKGLSKDSAHFVASTPLALYVDDAKVMAYAASASPYSEDSIGATSEEVTLDAAADVLTIIVEPPRIIRTGSAPKYVAVQAKTSAGVPVPNRQIEMTIGAASSLVEQGMAFLEANGAGDSGGVGGAKGTPSFPVIDRESASAVTDESGIAKFLVKLQSGKDGKNYYFEFSDGQVKSEKSDQFDVLSRVQATQEVETGAPTELTQTQLFDAFPVTVVIPSVRVQITMKNTDTEGPFTLMSTDILALEPATAFTTSNASDMAHAVKQCDSIDVGLVGTIASGKIKKVVRSLYQGSSTTNPLRDFFGCDLTFHARQCATATSYAELMEELPNSTRSAINAAVRTLSKESTGLMQELVDRYHEKIILSYNISETSKGPYGAEVATNLPCTDALDRHAVCQYRAPMWNGADDWKLLHQFDWMDRFSCIDEGYTDRLWTLYMNHSSNAMAIETLRCKLNNLCVNESGLRRLFEKGVTQFTKLKNRVDSLGTRGVRGAIKTGQLFKLFVGGGQKPLESITTVSSIATAKFSAVELISDAADLNGTQIYEFQNINVKFTKPGTARVQLFVDGNPLILNTSVTVDVKTVTSEDVYILNVVIYTVVALVLGGGVQATPYVFYVITVLVATGFFAFLFTERASEMTYALDQPKYRIPILVAYGTAIAAMLVGGIQRYLAKKGTIASTEGSFTTSRAAVYVRYVSRLINGDLVVRATLYGRSGLERLADHRVTDTGQQDHHRRTVWRHERSVRELPVNNAQATIEDINAEMKALKAQLKARRKEHKKAPQPDIVQGMSVADLEQAISEMKAELGDAKRALKSAQIAEARRAHPDFWTGGPIGQIVASVRGWRHEEEAIYIPVRLWAAGIISTFVLCYTTASALNTMLALAESVKLDLGSNSVRTYFKTLLALEAQYKTVYGGNELTDQHVQYLYDQASDLYNAMHALADGIHLAAHVALPIAFLVVLWGWLMCFTEFKQDVLSLQRTGKTRSIWLRENVYANKRVSKYSMHAWYIHVFIGISAANTLLSFVVIYFTLGLIIALIAWDTLRIALWDWLIDNIHTVLVLLLSPVIKIVLGEILKPMVSTSDGRYITDRRLYAAAEFLMMILGFVAGVVPVILRIIMALLGTIIGLSSIVSSASPAWVYSNRMAFAFGFMRDKLLAAYLVLVYQHARNNNPVAQVFMWSLQQSAKVSKAAAVADASDGARNGDASETFAEGDRLRARTRWFLALTLARNPVLQGLRKARGDEVAAEDAALDTASLSHADPEHKAAHNHSEIVFNPSSVQTDNAEEIEVGTGMEGMGWHESAAVHIRATDAPSKRHDMGNGVTVLHESTV